MTPNQDAADAQRTALTALPGVEQVLSDEGLSGVVGRRVRAVHERVKPGRSIVVSWRALDTDGTEPLTASLEDADHGWLMLTRDEDKVRSAQRRAQRLGLEGHVRVHDWDGDAAVLWGSLWTDPDLAAPIRRARDVLEQRHPEVGSWAVLRHNPKRRLVVRVGDEVVRIHADRLDAEDGMLATVARWDAAGVPVLALEPVGIKGTAAASPFWGAGDLYAVAASSADGAVRASAAAGEAIAAVHALPAAQSPLPALVPDAPAAAETIADAAPWLDDAVREAAALLQPLLEASCAEDPAVELHGDWSPDQVLAASADGARVVRIIDVDRARTGPAAVDLGCWNAACRREDLPALADAHAAGHARVHGESDRVTVLAWEAYAHLAAAVDPLRRRHADWAEQLTERVVLLRACLRELESARSGQAPHHDGGSLAPASSVTPGSPDAPASSVTPADASASASLPPAEVEAEGTVWAVDRCWPSGTEGELAVEVSAGDRLRAGLWKDGALELSPAEADPKLKALAPLIAEGGTVVSWRPRKRAVVRSAGPDGDVFTKVVRAGRAQGTLDGIARARPFEAGFRTPQVLDSTDATVGFAALPGRSLHDESAFTDAEWARAWADIADALSAARRTRPEDAGALPVHGPEQEADVLADWLERTAAWTGAQPRFARAVEKVGETLRGLPVVGNVPTHRDLHDKQLLWDPELGAGLLDVDTACLGDPALDLGNLRAHALWRERQGVWSASRADVVRRTVDELSLAEGLPAPRVGAYEYATLLRLRCVYALRPRYARAAAELEAELT